MTSTFDALAHVDRRRILDVLREREHCVNDLVTTLQMAQPSVSKHLGTLKAAGLVRVRQEARTRFYRLEVGPLGEVDRWLLPFRQTWAQRLDALEAHLDAMEEEP